MAMFIGDFDEEPEGLEPGASFPELPLWRKLRQAVRRIVDQCKMALR